MNVIPFWQMLQCYKYPMSRDPGLKATTSVNRMVVSAAKSPHHETAGGNPYEVWIMWL